MNLSERSESIHKSIEQLQEGVKHLQVADNLDWLTKTFKSWGLSGWLIPLVRTLGIFILTVVVVLLMLPCFGTFLQRALQKTVHAIFLHKYKKGELLRKAAGWPD